MAYRRGQQQAQPEDVTGWLALRATAARRWARPSGSWGWAAECAVHQQLGIRVLGVFDHLLDVTGFGHPTLIQHHDVVGDLIRRGRIVGDIQDRDAVHLIELTQVLENRSPQRGVHHGDRLVGDDDLRMQHQGARHHDALPLATVRARQPVLSDRGRAGVERSMVDFSVPMGSEAAHRRPAIIVSNNAANLTSARLRRLRRRPLPRAPRKR